jgi:WD40 repeat protein
MSRNRTVLGVLAWVSLTCPWLLATPPLAAQEPKPRATLTMSKGKASHLAFSPDGTTLACLTWGLYANDPSAFKLRDVRTGKERASDGWSIPDVPSPYVYEPGDPPLAFSPDGKTLALIAPDGKVKGHVEVRLWDVTTGRARATLRVHTAKLTRMAFSPDSGTLIAVKGGEVSLWDVATGKLRTYFNEDVSTSVAISPDRKTLAANGRVGATLWDVTTGKKVASLGDEQESLDTVAFSQDGKTLAALVATEKRQQGWLGYVGDYRLKRWDAATGKELSSHDIKKPGWLVWSWFSPDCETFFIVGLPAAGMRRIDVKTGKERALELKGESRGYDIPTALGRDGKTLATFDMYYGEVRMWDVATGRMKASLPGHSDKREGQAVFVAFSPDGTTLATMDLGGEAVKLWDLATSSE